MHIGVFSILSAEGRNARRKDASAGWRYYAWYVVSAVWLHLAALIDSLICSCCGVMC